jgi:hypothetical protein
MLTLMYVFLLGLSVLLVVFLKHKLHLVEDDLRERLCDAIAARDQAGEKTWAHFNAQVRIFEGLLLKHFYTED